MNNYNTSTTGINIEAHVFYDWDAARMNWDESFVEIKEDWLPQEYMFTAYGNLSDNIPDVEEMVNLPESKSNLTKLRYCTVKTEGYLEYSEAKCDYTAYGLLEVLLDNGATLEVLDELDLEYTLNFETIVTRGYSQGDYATVLIPTKSLAELYGCEQDKVMDGLQESINHLFWDSPVYCRVEINGEENFPDCDGSYEYNKEEVINQLVKNTPNVDLDVLREELENTLPDEPRSD